MSNELNTGAAAVNANASQPSTPAAQPNVGQSQPSSQASGGQSSSVPQTFKLKVDNVEKELSYDDVVKYAQKGFSADERFQQAAQIKKEYDKVNRIVQNLDTIIKNRDFNKAKEIFGDDFVRGLSGAINNQPQYDEVDVRMAQQLEMQVGDYIDMKKKAMGIDNPIVQKQSSEIEALKNEIKALKGGVDKVKQETESAVLEYQFNKVAEKFPDVKKTEVLDIMISNGIPPAKMEEVFKIVNEAKNKELDDYYNKKIKEKENAAGSLTVNSGGIVQNHDQFKGKSLEQKAQLLKGL